MSRVWSKRSQYVRDTLDPRLQILCDRIRDEVTDVSLISGHRGETEQNLDYELGVSTLKYPHSKHNSTPSKAIDLQPYPYPKDEKCLWASLGYIAGRAWAIAEEEGFSIRWGGDWDRDGDVTDQQFYDLFHIEVFDG